MADAAAALDPLGAGEEERGGRQFWGKIESCLCTLRYTHPPICRQSCLYEMIHFYAKLGRGNPLYHRSHQVRWSCSSQKSADTCAVPAGALFVRNEAHSLSIGASQGHTLL